jgi:hypothetical protein
MISSKILGSLNFPLNIHVSNFSVSRQGLPRRFEERMSAQLLDETIDLRTCRVADKRTDAEAIIKAILSTEARIN